MILSNLSSSANACILKHARYLRFSQKFSLLMNLCECISYKCLDKETYTHSQSRQRYRFSHYLKGSTPQSMYQLFSGTIESHETWNKCGKQPLRLFLRDYDPFFIFSYSNFNFKLFCHFTFPSPYNPRTCSFYLRNN